MPGSIGLTISPGPSSVIIDGNLAYLYRTIVDYRLRFILMKNGCYDSAIGLVEAPPAESYGARNLSPRPNACGWIQLELELATAMGKVAQLP